MKTSPGKSRPARAVSRRSDKGGERDAVEISLDKLRERAEASKPSAWDLFLASFARALEEISGTVHLHELSNCAQPPPEKVEGDTLRLPAGEPPKWIRLDDATAVAKQTAQELEEKSKQLEVRSFYLAEVPLLEFSFPPASVYRAFQPRG